MPDYDRRLVDLYDEDNPDGPDHDFYRSLADEIGARSIIDLGCGTGLLTVTLAHGGRTVVGVDPSPNMIDFARGREHASAVEWVLGDSSCLPAESADLAVMTGNVAQHIDDASWPEVLRHLRRALRSGGKLAFESRNPATRAWESWSSPERSTRETAHGTLVEWSEVEEAAPGVVELVFHNQFIDADETVVENLTLRFRSRGDLERALSDAGFSVDAVYGDWNRGPCRESSQIMVFVASARR